MIDVFEDIKHLLVFESKDDFYYLQILQRKKDNPEIGSNSRVIKNYYITSVEYLENRYDEIKKLCDVFNARASLRLNRRSFRKTGFKALQNIANTMTNGEYHFLRSSYDRACGLGHNDKDKKWILDIDEDGNGEIECDIVDVYATLRDSKPEGNKFIIAIPTKSGVHIITKPFDSRELKEKYPEIDIHKDNPINLYIP